MHQKIIDLHHQLRRTEDNSPSTEAIELLGEILGVFGLPPNQGYEELLPGIGEMDDLSESEVDQASSSHSMAFVWSLKMRVVMLEGNFLLRSSSEMSGLKNVECTRAALTVSNRLHKSKTILSSIGKC